MFRNCRDFLRPGPEHEACPRGVQGRSGVHEVYFYQEDHEADRDGYETFRDCVEFRYLAKIERVIGDGHHDGRANERASNGAGHDESYEHPEADRELHE